MTRKDLENATFEAWGVAEGLHREALEKELRNLLLNHAQAVQYAILRRTDPALLVEAVDKVMLNLPEFEGKSLFTTWAHKTLASVMYDQRRSDRRRKGEISMETPGFDIPGEPSNELTDVLLTIQKTLDEEDQRLFNLLLIEGLDQAEVAKELGVSQQTVSRNWLRVQRTLQHAFAK